MASPQVRTVEYDLSQNPAAYEGMYGLIIGNFNKGPIGDRTFITDQRQADLVLGKPEPGSDVAYYILHTFLTKSKRCWVRRVVDSATYGGIKVGATFNTNVGTGNAVAVTFSGTLPLGRCHPGTVSIWIDDTKVAYDNSSGVLVGSLLDGGAPDNAVDYSDGSVNLKFLTAPPNGAKIYARWGYPNVAFASGMATPSTYGFDDYQLTQEIEYSGSAYSDNLVPYPLVAPTGTVTGIGNATLVIGELSTGGVFTPVIYADENGDLNDHTTGTYLLSSPPNTVNYTNGVLSFNLDAGYTPTNPLVARYYSTSTHSFLVYADNPGSWSDSYQILISKADPVKYQWVITVQENRGGNLGPVVVDQFIVSKEHKKDGFDRQMYMEERISGNSYYIRVKDNPYLDPDSELDPDWMRYSLPSESLAHNSLSTYTALLMAGGVLGNAPAVANYITALQTFDNKEDVKVDIIMDTVMHYTYQQAIITMCDRERGGRGDCYGILAIPPEVEESNNYISEAINYRKYTLNVSTSYCGLYFGQVKIYDTYNGREIWIPPTGFIAAAFAFTADQFEPWFPAAGWKRGILPVLDLYRRLKLGERDALYDNDINAMKYKPGRGIAIWGQKTLLGTSSALDRANVRWLLIVCENSIEEFLDDHEFELNDAYERALVHSAVYSYLSGIQVRRGLYTFDVVCDDSNNPAELVDQYRMNVDYYLQPTKAAEYIYARAVITRTGVDFAEVRIT